MAMCRVLVCLLLPVLYFCSNFVSITSDGVKDMTHEAKAKAMTHKAKGKAKDLTSIELIIGIN